MMRIHDMTPRQKVGQRFAVGFSGTEISDELRRLVREYKVGNVILFRENLASAAQAKNLCREIKNLVLEETGCPAFIAIDQEGGSVVRLPDDMVNVPGAMALAASGSTENVSQAAGITAAELGRIGVNLNLAPVLDVNSARDNPAIGNRSFSVTARETASFAVAAIRAYMEAGLMCCGKHFPGHGDTVVDSHLDLPVEDRGLVELEERELVPFRAAVNAGVPAIMTTHILFPRIEPERLPATMSPEIIKGLLRKKLGFEGLVLSDGMEMNAIKNHYGVSAGCVLALVAGVDMVFVCHESPDVEASLRDVNAAFEEGRFELSEFDASVERILGCKERYANFGNGGTENPPRNGATEARKNRNNILMRSAVASRREPETCAEAEKPPLLGDSPFFAGCLEYRSTFASTGPGDDLSFCRWFAERFGGSFAETPANPTGDYIAGVASAMPQATSVVVGTYNGHLNRGQTELARALFEVAARRGIPFAWLALGNPWDLCCLPKGAYGLALWEYTEKSFEAAAAVFRGEFIPSGRLSGL